MKLFFYFFALFLTFSAAAQDTTSNVQQPKNPIFNDLNVKIMSVSRYGAGSQAHEADLGGHGTSSNFPKTVLSKQKFKKAIVAVEVKTDLKTSIYEQWNAYRVYLYNTTSQIAVFGAADGRLDMVMQAQDSTDTWKDIEALSGGWCGNSYHFLTLKPNEYWALAAPRYTGCLKTQFRLKVSYSIASNEEQITIYSNTFKGTVNPEQFVPKKRNSMYGDF